MTPDALGYMPLSKRRIPRLDRTTKILLCLACFSGIALFWSFGYFRSSDRFGPLTSAMDNYQQINAFPMIHQGHEEPAAPDQRAVVSSMYTDSYVFPLAVLAHSLSQHHVDARKILIYIPSRISDRSLCYVRSAGWELHPVELIPPPHGGKDIHYTFVDQYTKLSIWTLDQLGVKTGVYLDADTIVRRNFDEIWNLPFEFGAVPDIYVGDPGFTPGFNAGILLFHPSTDIFNDMISKLETTKFRLKDAEQSYLNHYFGAQAVRLPYAYGGNLAIKERSPEMWDAMQNDIRIVHYTLTKPFEFKPKCLGGVCDPNQVFDLKRHQEFLAEAKKSWKGHFAQELTWWEDSFNLMIKEIAPLCPATS